MKRINFFIVCVLLVMVPGMLAQEIRTAKHSVVLEDAAGDVNDGDHPGKDVVKVILDTDGTDLNITVVLAKEAKFYLDGHMAGDVIDLILDTDNNKTTGGESAFYGKTGFEFLIEVGACIEYEGGGMACSGALEGAEATNFFSTYSLEKHIDKDNKEMISEPFNWKARGKDIQGNSIKVSVPYSQMNLSPGQQVRLAVRERDDNTLKNEYLPEVLLTIK